MSLEIIVLVLRHSVSLNNEVSFIFVENIRTLRRIFQLFLVLCKAMSRLDPSDILLQLLTPDICKVTPKKFKIFENLHTELEGIYGTFHFKIFMCK